MKRTLALLLAVLLLTAFAGCASNSLKKPVTELEFWIGENVDGVDFSEYREKPGIMGGREYYGRGYAPEKAENGEETEPKECVLYTVTSYPDYSSKAQHVTRIVITDPSVGVYGLKLGSPADEIGTVMKKNGFKLNDNADPNSFVKGKFTIRFSNESIVLSVEVSNRNGIVF